VKIPRLELFSRKPHFAEAGSGTEIVKTLAQDGCTAGKNQQMEAA
jgi:hypothetical protein